MAAKIIKKLPIPDGDTPQYVYEAKHRIYYNTKQPVPIKEVIIALQGLDGVLRTVPLVLTALTGIESQGSEFLIESLETGSLIEDVAIKFFFKDRANLDAFVEKMGEKKIVKTAVIAAIIGGVVGYGLHWAAGQKATPTIQATNSVIIQNGAGALNITPEAFAAALQAATVGNKKPIAESALKLTSPVRGEPGSEVTFGEPNTDATPNVRIPHSAVAEAPARIELKPYERTEELKNTVLNLRATDLDSKKRGWAGRLDSREDRLPIELDPSVAESEIFGRTSVRVDAALVFREKGKSRELKPARIYVRKVHPSTN